MNSKQIKLISLAACSLVVLAVGCCGTQKPGHNDEIPRITMQPEDTQVSTNGTTNLVVKIRWENKDNYCFAWYKEVPFDCPRDSGRVVFAYELQTRPGWDKPVLQFENPKTDDQGNYFCVITHELNCTPPKTVQTKTRTAFLQVYQTKDFRMAGNIQVQAQPISYTGPHTTSTCYLASYTGSKTFDHDDATLAPFVSPPSTPPINRTCRLTVSRSNGNIFLPMPTTQFEVKIYKINPPVKISCQDTKNPNDLQFSAPSGTTYQFVVRLANADGATYQLKVEFL